jgi:hypothetical protein
VSERGIEANLEMITAITWMGPICNVKGVQRLTGYLAALSRFISLHKLLKKSNTFLWMEEAPAGFGQPQDINLGSSPRRS